MAKTRKKLHIDVMSIVILLVMTLFGGLIGFYMGQAAGINAAFQIIGIK